MEFENAQMWRKWRKMRKGWKRLKTLIDVPFWVFSNFCVRHI
jgi:hypothetical protein